MLLITENIFGPQTSPEHRLQTATRSASGVHHAHQMAPFPPRAGMPIQLRATTSIDRPVEEMCAWYTTDGSHPARPQAQKIHFVPLKTQWDHLRWAYVLHWQAEVPPLPPNTMLRYIIGTKLSGQPDAWLFAENQTAKKQNATLFSRWLDGRKPPDWARSAVIYQIFLDRFALESEHDWEQTEDLRQFSGGTLRGVTGHLDQLADWGYNALWLSPVFPSPSHHRYDPTDLFSVDPRLGSLADFDELVQAAHQRGLRVILDFVANHWSNLHPTFRQAQSSPESGFRDWYYWDNWPHQYHAFFDLPAMPKLNLQLGSPARAHVLEAAQFWLKRGVDGFRLDHANGPNFDFWADFRRACLQMQPECWLFGEVVSSPDAIRSYTGSLDGALDFHVAVALRETFGLGNWTLDRLDAFLAAHFSFFPSGFGLPAFIDNHDMDRFCWLANGERSKLKLAALMLFSLPGPPVVYYGTAAGVPQMAGIHQGVGFDEARRPMVWGNKQDADLLAYFRRLIALRKSARVWQGVRRRLLLDAERGVYIFAIEAENRHTIIALNTSAQPQNIRLPWADGNLPEDCLGKMALEWENQELMFCLEPESGAWLM